jgi:hypothetical protein
VVKDVEPTDTDTEDPQPKPKPTSKKGKEQLRPKLKPKPLYCTETLLVSEAKPTEDHMDVSYEIPYTPMLVKAHKWFKKQAEVGKSYLPFAVTDNATIGGMFN